jgi:hypothetical protein
MSALGTVALIAYVFGFLAAFYLTVREIARDETRQRQRGERTSPDWLNGALAIVAALFWPVIAIVWAIGRLYRLTARAAK